MVPAAAQRFRDRAARGVGTAAGLHRDDGVVRKRLTIHEDLFNRSALQRRQYVEQEVAAGGVRVGAIADGDIARARGVGGGVVYR